MRTAAKLRLAVAALAALAPLASAPALADGSYSLTMRGYVPLVCRAEIRNTAQPSDGGAMTGELHEFCNGASGYAVYAQLANPEMEVSIDGVALTPDADGRVLLSKTDRPTIASRRIALSGAEGGAISISVVAAA